MNLLMKNISVVFLTLLTSCAVQKTTDDISEVAYSAMTRGRSEQITIIKNKLIHKTSQSTKEVVLSNDNRKALLSVISKIKLTKINKLKATSGKRLYDGAMAASFSIKKKETTYTSSTFDHDNPPIELKALYDLLKSFIQKQ